MEALRTYLLGIAVTAMAVTLLSVLLKEGVIRRAVRLAGGVVLILAVLGPLLRNELDAFGSYLTELKMREDALQTGIEVENADVLERIIRRETEAYILDKAAALGAEVTVTVTVEQGGHYPYPYTATVEGKLTDAQRNALSEDLELSLASPKERQVFTP